MRCVVVVALALVGLVTSPLAAVNASDARPLRGAVGQQLVDVETSASTTPIVDTHTVALTGRRSQRASPGVVRLVSGCCVATKAGANWVGRQIAERWKGGAEGGWRARLADETGEFAPFAGRRAPGAPRLTSRISEDLGEIALAGHHSAHGRRSARFRRDRAGVLFATGVLRRAAVRRAVAGSTRDSTDNVVRDGCEVRTRGRSPAGMDSALAVPDQLLGQGTQPAKAAAHAKDEVRRGLENTSLAASGSKGM
jgi:hypothetical protein